VNHTSLHCLPLVLQFSVRHVRDADAHDPTLEVCKVNLCGRLNVLESAEFLKEFLLPSSELALYSRLPAVQNFLVGCRAPSEIQMFYI
jgi:hypothetical protein